MTPTPQEWIPREDAARLAGCSPDTIKRDEQRHGWITRVGEGGRVLVAVADLVAAGRISPEALTGHPDAATAAEAARSREQVAALRAEAAHLSGRLAERDTVLEELRAQVRLLREQSATKDRQMQGLQATIDRLLLLQPRPQTTAGGPA